MEGEKMTPDEVKLVQDSFAKVAPIAHEAADLFYDRLFAIAPGVRRLFPQDLAEQKKKLMAMLGTAIASLHEVERIVPAVQGLGRRHAGYGVTAAHYEPVGEALLWTLEQALAGAFTPAVKQAWTAAYMALTKVMTDAAAQVSGPAGKPTAA
jgi:hemoglobin-like flavoprotein